MGKETISSQELSRLHARQLDADPPRPLRLRQVRQARRRLQRRLARRADPQDPAHRRPAQHRAVRRRPPRPGDRQLATSSPTTASRSSRSSTSIASKVGTQVGSVDGPRRRRPARRSSSDEDIVVGVLAVPAARRPGASPTELVEAGVKIIFNYSDALLAGAAGGHRPHVEPGRRPALRALLLPGLSRPRARHDARPRSRRARLFEASTDFTVGLEEEFAILDPETLELAHALRGAATTPAQADEVLGRVDRRRADLLRDRDPLRPRRELRRRGRAPARAPRAAVRAGRAPRASRSARSARIRGPTTATSRSSTPSTTAASRTAWSTSPGATTPSACTSTSACAAPTARSRVCDRAARACCRCCSAISRQLAVPRRPRQRPALGAHPDLHPHASRAAASPTPFGDWDGYARLRRAARARPSSIVESTQLWWSVRPHHSFGTVEVRICDAQTDGDESARRWPG